MCYDLHMDQATVDAPTDVLAALTARLVRAFQPQRVVLFGSRAWGTPDTRSDYDLAVVVASSNESIVEREARARRALRDVGVSKDVLVYTVDEIAAFAGVAASLEHRILTDGRVLYDRRAGRPRESVAP